MLRNYKYLVSCRSRQCAQATPFMFYPLEPDDYVSFLSSYESDSRYPLMAFYYLTHECWDRCTGCFVARIDSPRASQPRETIERVLRDLASGGTKAIKYAGREATTSPHLSAALDLSAELGLKTVLITSGANIGEHASAIARSCTHLRVSLNTTDPVRHTALHRPLRKALGFKERLEWVEKIIAGRTAEGYIHGATFLIRPETLNEVMPYARLCRDLGFQYVRYTLLDEARGDSPERWDEVRAQLEAFASPKFQIWFNEPVVLSHEVPLHSLPLLHMDSAVTTRVTIHADGRVNACQEGWRGEWRVPGFATFGNLGETSFHDIWLGEARARFLGELRETLARGRSMMGCERCKYSDLTRLLRWISWHSVVAKDQILAAEDQILAAGEAGALMSRTDGKVHSDAGSSSLVHRHPGFRQEYADQNAESTTGV